MIPFEEACLLLPHLQKDDIRALREPYFAPPRASTPEPRPFHGIEQVPELATIHHDPPLLLHKVLYHYDIKALRSAAHHLSAHPRGHLSRDEARHLFTLMLLVRRCVADRSTQLIETHGTKDWIEVIDTYVSWCNTEGDYGLERVHDEPIFLRCAGQLLREWVSWEDFKSQIELMIDHAHTRNYPEVDAQDTPSDHFHIRYSNLICYLIQGFIAHRDVEPQAVEALVTHLLDHDSTIAQKSDYRGDIPQYRIPHLALLSSVPVEQNINQAMRSSATNYSRYTPHKREMLHCLIWHPNMSDTLHHIRSRSLEYPDAHTLHLLTAHLGEQGLAALFAQPPKSLPDEALAIHSDTLAPLLTPFIVQNPDSAHYRATLPLSTHHPQRLIDLLLAQLETSSLPPKVILDRLLGLAQHGHTELIEQSLQHCTTPVQDTVHAHVFEPFEGLLPEKKWPVEARRWYALGCDRDELQTRWDACLNDTEGRTEYLHHVILDELQVTPMLALKSGGTLPAECTLGFMVFAMEGALSLDKIKSRYTARTLSQICWCFLYQRSYRTPSSAEAKILSDLMDREFMDHLIARAIPGKCGPLRFSHHPYWLYSLRMYRKKLRSASDKRMHDNMISSLCKDLDITLDEFEDLSIWHFGFGPQGRSTLSYGDREFELQITSGLELIVVDLTEHKTITRLPPRKKSDDPTCVAQAKALYKEIRKPLLEELAYQGKRFEQAMLFKRAWTFGEARERLFEHPILSNIVKSLVWVMPNKLKSGTSRGMFRVTQDGSILDVEMNELKVSSRAHVRIAHPTDLKGVAPAWAEHLASFAIIQPFSQLDHEVFVKNDENDRLFQDFIQGTRELDCEAMIQRTKSDEGWSIQWRGGSRYTAQKASRISFHQGEDKLFDIDVTTFMSRTLTSRLKGWRAPGPDAERDLNTTTKKLSPVAYSVLLEFLASCEHT